jgi:hypothetical protein
MHTYIHTYIQTYIHTYKHTYIHTNMHVCTRTYIHTHMCIHTYIHTSYQTCVPRKQLYSGVSACPRASIRAHPPAHAQQFVHIRLPMHNNSRLPMRINSCKSACPNCYRCHAPCFDGTTSRSQASRRIYLWVLWHIVTNATRTRRNSTMTRVWADGPQALGHAEQVDAGGGRPPTHPRGTCHWCPIGPANPPSARMPRDNGRARPRIQRPGLGAGWSP